MAILGDWEACCYRWKCLTLDTAMVKGFFLVMMTSGLRGVGGVVG